MRLRAGAARWSSWPAAADVIFVGVGQMGERRAACWPTASSRRDELDEMQAAGRGRAKSAAGSIDSDGRYLDLGTNRAVGGVRVEPGLAPPGRSGLLRAHPRFRPSTAALKSRIINGLVTDEPTAARCWPDPLTSSQVRRKRGLDRLWPMCEYLPTRR